MKRICATCAAPGRKASCCEARFCDACVDRHAHPELLLRKPTRETPEGKLKRDVAQLLDRCGVLYVRVNAGGFRGRMLGAPKGTPDFLGVHLAMAFAIETKATHGDACSGRTCGCAAQRDWRAEFEARGGHYILARSTDDVVRGLSLALEVKGA